MSATTTATVLPNLFIIGAAKCGTTSLHHYLDLHPEISMSEPKEPTIFGYAAWESETARYARMFSSPDSAIRGESSPRYSSFPLAADIPRRVASVCPDARLIYMVRDPVPRVVSHYVELYASMLENRTFANAMKDHDQPANPYVAASRYATQLEEWLKYFDRDRILVFDQTELRDDRAATYLAICDFLGVERRVPAGVDAELNVGLTKERMTPASARLWTSIGKPVARRFPAPLQPWIRRRLFRFESLGRPALSDELRLLLEAELRDEADRFRALTGMDFASWSV